jgi:hypothetical protein
MSMYVSVFNKYCMYVRNKIRTHLNILKKVVAEKHTQFF